MYQFFLNGMLFPVAPASLSIKIQNQNKTVTLINDGQINLLKTPGLSKISFSVLLPNHKYPFAQYISGFQKASFFTEKLEQMKISIKPVPFYIVRLSNNQIVMASRQMNVSLESYELIEDADKYGVDVMAKIKLLQYKEFGTKKVEFKQNEDKTQATLTEQRETSTAPGVGKQLTYTVKEGDTLWIIAKTYLGNSKRSGEIYQINQTLLEETAKKYGKASSSNGWWLFPGTVLNLPEPGF